MREFVLTPVTRLRGLFMAVMMIAVCAMQTVSATDDGAGTQSLAAIRTVALQISGVNKDWARRGFDQTQLYAEVETHLQAAGFKVISPAALKDYPDAALLSLELHVNNTLVNWSYLVFLKLKVKVPVPVNPKNGYWYMNPPRCVPNGMRSGFSSRADLSASGPSGAVSTL